MDWTFLKFHCTNIQIYMIVGVLLRLVPFTVVENDAVWMLKRHAARCNKRPISELCSCSQWHPILTQQKHQYSIDNLYFIIRSILQLGTYGWYSIRNLLEECMWVDAKHKQLHIHSVRSACGFINAGIL